MKKGKVYFIGAGPGVGDLITLRGSKILQQADVVIYDYLAEGELLGLAKKGAELICCDRLGKKRYSDGFLLHNEKISQLVVKKARQGKNVVRLKNGDPSIFGRLRQELEPLVEEKIEFEIVPGVTAGCAASALSGIPLTDRKSSSSCVFVTGHEDPGKKESSLDWQSLSKIGTIILYMAVENLAQIVKRLSQAGKPLAAAVAIVENAGLITQRVVTGSLGDIIEKAKRQKIRPPVIIIIGEVVKLGRDFNWFIKNKRVLFTGLSEKRPLLKGSYFYLPLVKIEPLDNYAAFDKYLKGICGFDWVLFTSRYGVKYFFQRLAALSYDARFLSGRKIAAIGNSTAGELREFGISADLIPRDESSKGLFEALKNSGLENKNVFLPRSDISDKGLVKGLKKLGARVSACVVYKNVMPQDLPDLDLGSFDEIIFTSPSGVRNFVKRYGLVPKRVKVSCVGEVTRAQAKKLHLVR